MNKNKDSFDDLDLRVINTISGRQLVGELVEVQDDCIYLNETLECKTIVYDDGSYETLLIPASPLDHSNILVLQLSALESETEASWELKQAYINQLESNVSILSKYQSDNNNVNQTNLTDLAKQDYWKDFKDDMLS